MRNIRTREEAVDRLRSGCDQCISCLRELISIQFELDPVGRVIGPDDEEIVYRLRKVLLHVKAITSWELDTEVMHVLAPEFRVAEKQIDKIWKKVPREQLTEYLSDGGESVVGGYDKLFKSEKNILSACCHPTPQRLMLPKELGGLGRPDEVLCFINLFALLLSLIFRYGVSLAFLSQTLGGSKEDKIASVMGKVREECASISPSDCLPFIARERS